jgi:hypothetical protein
MRIRYFAAAALILPTMALAATVAVRPASECSVDGDGSSWSCATGAGQAGARRGLPSALVRGNTYYLARGTYGSYTWDDPVSGTTTVRVRKAVAADHGPATGWVDTLADGQAAFSDWKFRSGYYDIDGVTGGGPRSWTTGHGIKVVGSANILMDFNSKAADNVRIAHVEATSTYGRNSNYNVWVVKGVKDDASSVYFAKGDGISNASFEYCYFHDVGGGHFHTFAMKNVTIQYSALARNGEGHPELHREVWSGVNDDNITWRWNWIEDSTNTAVFAHVNGGSTDRVEIYGNVIVQSGLSSTHASRFIDVTYPGTTATNWKVYNNTLVGWISGGAGIEYNGSGNVAYNNLFAHHPASDTIAFTAGLHDYNGFYSILNWQSRQDMAPALASSEAHGQLFSATPFTNNAAKDFTLRAATQAGVSLSAPFNVDMFGNTRGADGVWDRGAFEFGAGAVAPLSAPTNLRVL